MNSSMFGSLLFFSFILWCSAAQMYRGPLQELHGGNLKGTGCECNSTSCGCCADLVIEKIELNTTVCVNVSYLPEELGFSFTLSLGGEVIYNETVSVKNPPPICFGVPYLEKYFGICIHFYDMEYSTSKLSGCIKLEARLYDVVVESIELGCFTIPPSDAGFVMKINKIKNKRVFQQGFDNYIH
ncbi:uncharacterized protein LOC144443451 [Glandiceps talaboti]